MLDAHRAWVHDRFEDSHCKLAVSSDGCGTKQLIGMIAYGRPRNSRRRESPPDRHEFVDHSINSHLHYSNRSHRDNRGTKLKVDNLHYDLSKTDLQVSRILQYCNISNASQTAANVMQGLFEKIGPVLKIDLVYDRAGRSEGTAFVIYDHREDALAAIREFNGANAKGTL